MTVEDCRVILKVHIRSAEAVGSLRTALALQSALQSIDEQIALELQRALGNQKKSE